MQESALSKPAAKSQLEMKSKECRAERDDNVLRSQVRKWSPFLRGKGLFQPSRSAAPTLSGQALGLAEEVQRPSGYI